MGRLLTVKSSKGLISCNVIFDYFCIVLDTEKNYFIQFPDFLLDLMLLELS